MEPFRIDIETTGKTYMIKLLPDPQGHNRTVVSFKYHYSAGIWYRKYVGCALVDGVIRPFIYAGSVNKIINDYINDGEKQQFNPLKASKLFHPGSDVGIKLTLNLVDGKTDFTGSEMISHNDFDFSTTEKRKWLIEEFSKAKDYINLDQVALKEKEKYANDVIQSLGKTMKKVWEEDEFKERMIKLKNIL